MTVDKKDLEELYDLVSELFWTTDIPSRYHYELYQKFEAIQAKIEAES